MVQLSTLSPPQNAEIEHAQPNTTLYVSNDSLGSGTLYIGHNNVAWLNENGQGFTLRYQAISLHAVCKDISTFPHQCLYVMLDASLAEEFRNDPTQMNGISGEDGENEEEEEEEDLVRELRFVPQNSADLETMYAAMSECQKLHPDPEDECSEDEEEDEEEGNYYEQIDESSMREGQFFTDESGLEHLTPEGRATLNRLMNRMELQDDNMRPGGMAGNGASGDAQQDPNQFDDADAMDH